MTVGETGIDNAPAGRLDGVCGTRQRKAFCLASVWPSGPGKPLIHNRQAIRGVLDVLQAEGAPDTLMLLLVGRRWPTYVDAGWLQQPGQWLPWRRELRKPSL